MSTLLRARWHGSIGVVLFSLAFKVHLFFDGVVKQVVKVQGSSSGLHKKTSESVRRRSTTWTAQPLGPLPQLEDGCSHGSLPLFPVLAPKPQRSAGPPAASFLFADRHPEREPGKQPLDA